MKYCLHIQAAEIQHLEEQLSMWFTVCTDGVDIADTNTVLHSERSLEALTARVLALEECVGFDGPSDV